MYTPPSDHLGSYLSEIERIPRLNRTEELELARRYQSEGDLQAAHVLVEAHLHSVVRMAQQYRGYRLSFADLLGEGTLGLLEAVKRFEPERGLRFFTYGRHWVRAYILAFVLKQWSIVDMGTSAQQSKLFFRLQAEYGRLVTQLGEDDDSIESRLAERFGVAASRIRFALSRLRGRDVSLDAPLVSDGATTFVDMLRYDGPTQEQHATAREEQRLVQEAVANVWSGLSLRQQTIVRERLLAGDESKSLAELGRGMGITRERVRQIEADLKARLKIEIELLTDAEPVAA